MQPNTLFTIIIVIIVADYLWERILDYLNSTRWSDKLPDELKGIYDEEKYRKSQQYDKEKQRFSFITDTFSFILILLMLFLGGFAFIDQIVRDITENPIWMAILFFGIIGLAADILALPFSIYGTFVIEQKYGFNKTTPKTFVFDKLKGWLLGGILGGGILALIVWIYTSTGEWFWLITWIALGGFMVFMSMFYSNLIVPLFNKQTPLEEGDLRNAIEDFASKVGFKLKNIYVMDGSKRSTKANAYFTGLGPKKRIVLFDTLIDKHSNDELVAVLAHEIGHYKLKHTTLGVLLSLVQTGIMLYILSLFIGNPVLSQALGAEEGSFHMGLLAFGLLYSPISLLLGWLMNMVSRKNEYAADHFAGNKYKAEALIIALKKLSVDNLSNLRPHPLYVAFYYSHPPLLKRIGALKRIEQDT
ncbi:MAG: M48 family metallopeptidase [Bacteroidales bacterium]|nr:M48 family metallopeptidase [Bacteroidales bacterium]MCF8387185.1 M48 family metallopeptidase [Bacteroidales bacterium]MCF8396930.1 M48 family metallopeptidase [Bacteroidales bacterium]